MSFFLVGLNIFLLLISKEQRKPGDKYILKVGFQMTAQTLCPMLLCNMQSSRLSCRYDRVRVVNHPPLI
jgi:hypothetical protein